MQHLKQLTEKQEREKAEREVWAVKRRSGATSPILDVMTKELETATKVTEASTTWSTGCTPSAGPLAEEADPEKAGKNLLVSTFSFI